MSRIAWIDTHQMVTSLDCRFPRRLVESVGSIVLRTAQEDEAPIDHKPGECYVYDRFRGIVIEFKSAT